MKFLPPQDANDEKVDMAPMIDMVFLLLIFFMVSSHLNQMERIEIDMPIAEHSKVPEEMTNRRTISIDKDGKIFLGIIEADLDSVRKIVTDEQKKIKDLKIYLRADRNIDHKYVREVMAECAAGGAAEILFAAYETE